MSNDNTSKGSDISLGGLFIVLLTIVFIVLKLCHVIEWSWVWVLSPLWISAGVVILFLLVFFTLIFIGSRN